MFGLARNERLIAEISTELAAAARPPASRRAGKEYSWSTRDSWSCQPRVIAKAEWTGGAANPRFIVPP